MKHSLALAAALALTGTPALSEEGDAALLASLGLTAASGKSTLADGAGSMEGAILAYPLLVQAARCLTQPSRNQDKCFTVVDEPEEWPVVSGRTVLVGMADSVDLSLAQSLERRIEKVRELANDICRSQSRRPIRPQFMSDTEASAAPLVDEGRPATDVLATIFGVLRTDETISSFDSGAPDHVLMGLLSKGEPLLAVPSELTKIDNIDDTKVGEAFVKLASDRRNLKKRAANCINPPKDDIEKIDAFFSAVNSPGEKAGPSLLELAARQELVSAAATRVMRVKIEKLGGTIVTKSGILYQFGFPGAIRARAGLIVSYRLIDPTTARLERAGMLICRRHFGESIKHVYATRNKRYAISNFRKGQGMTPEVSCENHPA